MNGAPGGLLSAPRQAHQCGSFTSRRSFPALEPNTPSWGIYIATHDAVKLRHGWGTRASVLCTMLGVKGMVGGWRRAWKRPTSKIVATNV